MSNIIKLTITIAGLISGMGCLCYAAHKNMEHTEKQESQLKALCLKSDLTNKGIVEICRDVKIKIGDL